jgi:hypothetical protein
VDPNNLDDEWRSQPGLSRNAGRREADARHAHAQCKATLSVVAARMALAVRRAPEKFNIREKPTVDEVNAAVELTPEYQQAVKDVDDAQLAWDYAKADTVAFVDRRKALENLVELLRLDYYSEQPPRPLSPETAQRMGQSRRENIRRAGDGGDD